MEMLEMFALCPNCHFDYLIIYKDGNKECTYCGYKEKKKVRTIRNFTGNVVFFNKKVKEDKK